MIKMCNDKFSLLLFNKKILNLLFIFLTKYRIKILHYKVNYKLQLGNDK